MMTSGIPIAIALALLAGTALAQDSAGTNQSGSGLLACRADAQKYCQGVAPGGGKIRDCLVGHMDDLTPACQSLVNKQPDPVSASAGPVVLACASDTKSMCKGVQPGGGRILDCLIDHQNDLSDGCYDALKKRQDAQDAAAAKKPQ